MSPLAVRLRRLRRRGRGQRDHPRRLLGARAAEVRGRREDATSHRGRGGGDDQTAVCDRGKRQGVGGRGASGLTAKRIAPDPGDAEREAADVERSIAAQASDGPGGGVHAESVGGTECVCRRRLGADRQQRERA